MYSLATAVTSVMVKGEDMIKETKKRGVVQSGMTKNRC